MCLSNTQSNYGYFRVWSQCSSSWKDQFHSSDHLPSRTSEIKGSRLWWEDHKGLMSLAIWFHLLVFKLISKSITWKWGSKLEAKIKFTNGYINFNRLSNFGNVTFKMQLKKVLFKWKVYIETGTYHVKSGLWSFQNENNKFKSISQAQERCSNVLGNFTVGMGLPRH